MRVQAQVCWWIMRPAWPVHSPGAQPGCAARVYGAAQGHAGVGALPTSGQCACGNTDLLMLTFCCVFRPVHTCTHPLSRAEALRGQTCTSLHATGHHCRLTCCCFVLRVSCRAGRPSFGLGANVLLCPVVQSYGLACRSCSALCAVRRAGFRTEAWTCRCCCPRCNLRAPPCTGRS